MAEESDKTASVKIEAEVDFVASEGSLDALADEVAARLNNIDANPKVANDKRGRVVTKAEVDVQANLDEQAIERDLQAALKDGFNLVINKENLRAQIMDALSKPFEITVNADVQGAGSGGRRPEFDSEPRVTRREVPEEVNKALNTKLSSGKGAGTLRDAVDLLYRHINQAFEAAGKGRFGSQPVEDGNQAEKAHEIMSRFGDRLDKIMALSTDNELGIPMPTGGSLTRQSLATLLGLKPDHPAIVSAAGSAMGLYAQGSKENTLSTRSADLLFARLSKMENPTAQEERAPNWNPYDSPEAKADRARAASTDRDKQPEWRGRKRRTNA